MRTFLFLFFVNTLFCFFGCGQNANKGYQNSIDELNRLSTKMELNLDKIQLDSTKIPRSLKSNGQLKSVQSKDWTSGFFPGILWQLYEVSQSTQLKDAAEKWTAFIEKEKRDSTTHDLGFKLYSSFGKGYRLTNNQAYKYIIIQASKTLITRYNEKIGALRSWDWNTDTWEFPVIIDNMMNLEMLFEATRLTGDSIYYHIAYQHAKTTLNHHFRPDLSSIHVVDFDPMTGAVRNKVTHQGFSDESAWSRGQAWGLYGFVMSYGFTKDVTFLNQARSITEFIFNHPNLPEDKIPYWDFNAPNIPNEPRDVSAATVAASALLELCKYDLENRKQYLGWADKILNSLSQSKYQSNISPFFLNHSTGSVPGDFEVDVPIVYADYYYVEALLRRKEIGKNRD